MSSRGRQTVSKSHFGPRNCQTLLLMKIEKEIPLSGASSVYQALPGCMEWAPSQKSPSLDAS